LGRNLFTQVSAIASDFFSAGDLDKQLFGARLFKVFCSNNVCPISSELFKPISKGGPIVKRLAGPDVSPHILLCLQLLVLGMA
jgi:hypothetical protein